MEVFVWARVSLRCTIASPLTPVPFVLQPSIAKLVTYQKEWVEDGLFSQHQACALPFAFFTKNTICGSRRWKFLV
jgi:hypothetical protein